MIDQFAGYMGSGPEWEDAGRNLFYAAARHHALARELVRLGHSVTVATACPEPPAGSEGLPMFARDEREGVEYLMTKSPNCLPGEHLKLGTVLAFPAALSENAEAIAALSKPDVVVSASAAPFDIAAAAKLAECAGAKLVWEMTDLEPESLVAAGRIAPWGPISLLLRRNVSLALSRSDRVLSPLLSADRWMESRGGVQKLCFVPEAAVDYKGVPCDEALPAVDGILKLKGEGRFVVVYAGPVTRDPALESLVAAAGELGSGYAVVIAGNGSHNVILKRMAKASGLENAHFFAGLSREGEQALCSAASVSFAADPPNVSAEIGPLAGNLLSRMLAGRPVVYASVAPPAMLVKTGCGVACEPGDPHSVAQAIAKLAACSKTELDSAGAAGRAYALDRHTPEKQAERWEKILLELV